MLHNTLLFTIILIPGAMNDIFHAVYIVIIVPLERAVPGSDRETSWREERRDGR